MMQDRFIVRPYHDEYRSGFELVDTKANEVVGSDGGEPEDQTLGRDWRWVLKLLNAVARGE